MTDQYPPRSSPKRKTAIDLAIERQEANDTPEPIPAADLCQEAAGSAYAHKLSYARGSLVLAWCDEHPAEVGEHQELVNELRAAMATNQPIEGHLLEIWVNIPETTKVGSKRARS